MPIKRRDRDSESSKMEHIPTDHELFLQAFESKFCGSILFCCFCEGARCIRNGYGYLTSEAATDTNVLYNRSYVRLLAPLCNIMAQGIAGLQQIYGRHMVMLLNYCLVHYQMGQYYCISFFFVLCV